MDLKPNHTAGKEREQVYTTLDPSLVRRKSLFIAYFLWLFGGFFGLHHFYLRRDIHAFITWATLGGFGFGWLADLFKLPAYVRDYNEDVDHIKELITKMRKNQKPPVTWYRRLASLIIATLFSLVLRAAIPVEYFEDESIYLRMIFMFVLPFSVAVGIHLVGNVGQQKGSFKIALLSSYVTMPVYLLTLSVDRGLEINLLVGYFLFEQNGVEWRRTRQPSRSLLIRVLYLSLAASLYIALWSSRIWFNCKCTDSEGENEVKCRDMIRCFFDSTCWDKMKPILRNTKFCLKFYRTDDDPWCWSSR